MEDMKKTLMEELLDGFREALEDSGIDKICQILMERKKKNVEDKGEQSAQLTFDFRSRIEVANLEFSIDSEIRLNEKNVYIFKAQRNFSLDAEQGQLPLGDGGQQVGEDPDADDEPGEGEDAQ